jgi:hypothetical protein
LPFFWSTSLKSCLSFGEQGKCVHYVFKGKNKCSLFMSLKVGGFLLLKKTQRSRKILCSTHKKMAKFWRFFVEKNCFLLFLDIHRSTGIEIYGGTTICDGAAANAGTPPGFLWSDKSCEEMCSEIELVKKHVWIFFFKYLIK